MSKDHDQNPESGFSALPPPPRTDLDLGDAGKGLANSQLVALDDMEELGQHGHVGDNEIAVMLVDVAALNEQLAGALASLSWHHFLVPPEAQ